MTLKFKSIWVTQDHRKWQHSISIGHEFLLAFHINYGIYLVLFPRQKRDIGRNRKSRFYTPPAFDAPVIEVSFRILP